MSDINKKPAIRFQKFTDAWEQRKLGDVLETVTDYVAAGSFADLAKNVEYKDSPDYAQLVRTMDLKSGFTSTQEVYVDKNAFDYLYRVNMDKECIILPNIGNCGEVYYVKPENLPYKHNVLGPNAIFVRSETAANNFLSILFQAKDFQAKLKLIVSPNGQTKFNKTELKRIDLILPADVHEQEKIGEYFRTLDNLITLHQRKYDKLKNIKKSMLEKMFPKNGSDVPEIRFKGFTDAWEQRKLTEFVEFFSGLTYTPNDVRENGTLVLRSSNVSNGEVVDADNVYVNPQVVNSENVKVGDIVVVVRNGSRSLIGKHAQIKAFMPNTVIGAFMTGIRSECPEFTNALLNTSRFEEEIAMNMGATINQITGYMFSKMEFKVPCLDEQKKIGEYFENLDNLITLHQRKLEKLKNIKKSMLEKMFV